MKSSHSFNKQIFTEALCQALGAKQETRQMSLAVPGLRVADT